jgi:hypothetical protein
MTATCCVDEKGLVQWALTWESGNRPTDCCCKESCQCSVKSSATEDLSGAYLVLVVTGAVGVGSSWWSEILFTKMSYEAMHALRMVLPGLCAGSDGDNMISRRYSLELIGGGLCSSGAACRCTEKSVCQDCESLREDERLFV